MPGSPARQGTIHPAHCFGPSPGILANNVVGKICCKGMTKLRKCKTKSYFLRSRGFFVDLEL